MAGYVPVTSSLEEIYTPDVVSTEITRWNHLLQTFKVTYGHEAEFVARSPGRVNIIGEHIDYSLYSVLPMAINADCLLAISTIEPSETPSGSSDIDLHLSNVQSSKFPSRQFKISHENIEIDSKVHEWTNYFKCGLKGALDLLKAKRGADFRPRGLRVLVDGSVPSGGGLSSSAAFVSASALAVMFANGEKEVDKKELTELAIVSERSVGVNSGGMDQSASVFSTSGSALYVSFVPSLTARPVSLPKTQPELSFVIAQSFVAADKQVTGPISYNLRVVECSLAAAFLHEALKKTSDPLPPDFGPLGISLRGFHNSYFGISPQTFDEQLAELIELTKSIFTREEGYTREEIAKVLKISKSELERRFESIFPVRAEKFKLRQRALHVFSEALRVQKFLQLLEHPESFLAEDVSGSTESYNKKLGDLMNETQDSCRELYECSCLELDELCTIAQESGAYGSRLTGAGWGGCSVHLVPADKVDAVRSAWEKKYYAKRGLTTDQKAKAVVVSKPGSGSSVFIINEMNRP